LRRACARKALGLPPARRFDMTDLGYTSEQGVIRVVVWSHDLDRSEARYVTDIFEVDRETCHRACWKRIWRMARSADQLTRAEIQVYDPNKPFVGLNEAQSKISALKYHLNRMKDAKAAMREILDGIR
jgi:hypothetical protein